MHSKSTDILTGKMPVPPLREEQILEAVASGDQPAADIARQAEMSILELAEHVCTAQNIAALGRVAQLHAIEREMLLGKLQRDALLRLAELTDEVPAGSADEVRAFEVMRKACTDLLRSGGLHTEKRPSSPEGPGGSRSRGYHAEPLTPAFEAEVLEALERLGQEDEEEDKEVYPQITQIAQMGCGGFKSGDESRYEPRARASGSVVLPPPASTSSPEVPSPPEVMGTRTGGTLMPPNLRRTANRILNSENRILPDDAHPP